jgi:hypothetical protein
MIYQEDVMLYFDEISRQLREENIPIFNNIIYDYPDFPNRDEEAKFVGEEESESEED